MIPTIGRLVIYTLTADDATQINRRRTTGKAIADRIANGAQGAQWPIGAQAHIGNNVAAGDTFPMLIVRVWGTSETSAVNGQVFLDSNDVFWATSRTVGDQPGTWAWPARI